VADINLCKMLQNFPWPQLNGKFLFLLLSV